MADATARILRTHQSREDHCSCAVFMHCVSRDFGRSGLVLEQMEGCNIAKPDFVANSVRIQLQPDGIPVRRTHKRRTGARISDGAILAPQGGS